MTRRLRPPVPLWVRCHPDGRPAALRRSGRVRTITRIAERWDRPASWWSGEEDDDAPPDPLLAARTYFKVIVDGVASYEIFQSAVEGQWFMEKIID